MSSAIMTEKELFDRLYEEEPWLRQYLYYCGIRTEDMDEVLQDIMVTAWRKYHTLQDQSSFKPWLRTMAQRKAIRYHKIRERRWTFHYSLSQLEEEREETGQVIPDGLIHNDPENFCHTEVYQLVMELGCPASNILILHHVYGEQFDEIASTLHMNENTVRSIASRSRTKLRKRFEERGILPYGKK